MDLSTVGDGGKIPLVVCVELNYIEVTVSRFTVYPVMPSTCVQESQSDRAVLSRPSLVLVTWLLDSSQLTASTAAGHGVTRTIGSRLAAALAACAQLSSLAASQRMWSLQTLRQLMTSGYGTSINIPALVSETSAGADSLLRPVSSSALEVLLKGLPEMLLRQYEYEDPIVRGGKHLMHSTFFKELIALGCDLGLDSLPCCKETHKWAWFRRYCVAARVATALINRTPLPQTFCVEVRKKIIEMVADDEAFSLDHESHAIFKAGHDEQLLVWLHRKPEDWTLSWGGAGAIYGWGHNHRGQLGGVDGAKVVVTVLGDSVTIVITIAGQDPHPVRGHQHAPARAAGGRRADAVRGDGRGQGARHGLRGGGPPGGGRHRQCVHPQPAGERPAHLHQEGAMFFMIC